MADLSPDLKQAIRELFQSHDEFWLADNRMALLKPRVAAWAEAGQFKWDSPPYVFFTNFIEQLPPAALRQALQGVGPSFGAQDEPLVASLCARIEAETERITPISPDPLIHYFQAQIRQLSTARYQVDSRFVQLTLLVDQGREAQGLRFVADSQRSKYDSLNKLLAEVGDRALVLLGRPGSGKTTLLRRLQLERAWELLPGAAGQIPFFVSLNGYRGAESAAALPDPQLWLAQQWQAQQPDLPDFATLCQQGRLLLLLDGLNEMPHRDREDYGERIARWQLFVQQATSAGNTLLFSCRSLDYSVPLDSETMPVRQVDVEPLTAGQMEQFLALYLGDEGDAVWQALRQDGQQLALFAIPFFLRLLVDQKLATGELLTSRVALLTGFVRRALYREVQERRHRLFAPGDLLTASDGQQVIHNRWAAPWALPQQGVLIPKLEALAYAMQDGRTTGEAGQVRLPEKTAYTLIAHPLAEEIVAAGIQLNVLDKELSNLEITYLHQLLQEYFAARLLARQPEPARVQTAWRADQIQPRLAAWLSTADISTPLPPAPTTGWEESTVMAAAMATDPIQAVRDLMAVNLPLAARCAVALEGGTPPSLLAVLQPALLARITDAQADLRARIAAAEALAEVGDPRFERHTGPYGAYLRPPLAPVAGGVYRIGSEERKGLARLWQSWRGRSTGYDDEKPAHDVTIAPFEMGVFPVTNAEYALFMAAGGYQDERWWQSEAAKAWLRGEGSSEGRKQGVRDIRQQLHNWTEEEIRGIQVAPDLIDHWIWLKNVDPDELEQELEEAMPTGEMYRQPEYWEDGRFNHPSRPVVGITWFEARAYCAWLSAQTGEQVDLPTEVEWEAAARGRGARGRDGRAYAYGNTFDTARCNTFETHIRRTTPVGVFPDGRSPAGIYDLSGNVWEWTSTIWGKELNKPDFPYPYDAVDGREDPADGDFRRVVRGGSWGGSQNVARAASRARNLPSERVSLHGFRLVVRRPPSHPDH